MPATVGRRARLYEAPLGEIAAHSPDEVRPAWLDCGPRSRRERMRGMDRPMTRAMHWRTKLRPLARKCRRHSIAVVRPVRLLCACSMQRSVPRSSAIPPRRGSASPGPAIERADYLAAASRVRDHLFAGDFYQANLTFGCDVPTDWPAARGVCPDALAVERPAGAGWCAIRAAGCSVAEPRAILHASRAACSRPSR